MKIDQRKRKENVITNFGELKGYLSFPLELGIFFKIFVYFEEN